MLATVNKDCSCSVVRIDCCSTTAAARSSYSHHNLAAVAPCKQRLKSCWPLLNIVMNSLFDLDLALLPPLRQWLHAHPSAEPVPPYEALHVLPLVDQRHSVNCQVLWASAVVLANGAAHCYPAVHLQQSMRCSEVHASNVLQCVSEQSVCCKQQ
jgi:hypothetical protein